MEQALKLLAEKQNLSYEQAKEAINEMMSGNVSAVQTAAFLTALSMKGETIDEIAGAADAMRSHALPISYDKEVLEIVGTGGDGANTFNISTTSAFVVAASGIKVAKHGNRAASSKSGAADVLEALGVNVVQDPKDCVRLLDQVGLCFFFAQHYHSAMKYVGPVRKELKIRTIFNILGPLTNPAKPTYDLIGVYSDELVRPIAEALKKMGVKSAMVVHGEDGMDEISASGKTKVCELNDGEIKEYELTPEDVGLVKGNKEDLIGGDPKENAEITKELLSGKKDGIFSTRRNAILLNAGAALYIGGKAETHEAGVKLAAELIDSGKALEVLQNFASESQKGE